MCIMFARGHYLCILLHCKVVPLWVIKVIGVVGPTRMDYADLAARLSYFAEGLSRMFGKGEIPPPAGSEPEE